MEDEIEMQEEETAAGAVDPQETEGTQADSEQTEAVTRQSHEENRRFQAARRKGDQAGYERRAREELEIITALGMRNPIDNREIRTLEDLSEYGKAFKRQKNEELAKKTGRPLAEIEEEQANREYISRQRREAEARESTVNNRAAQDIAELQEAYPEVDVNKLLEDDDFMEFCDGRIGQKPLADLYESYTRLTGKAAKAAEQKKESKQKRATGAGGGSGNEALSAEQQASLDMWNRQNPHLKMSAKEYMQRSGR